MEVFDIEHPVLPKVGRVGKHSPESVRESPLVQEVADEDGVGVGDDDGLAALLRDELHALSHARGHRDGGVQAAQVV